MKKKKRFNHVTRHLSLVTLLLVTGHWSLVTSASAQGPNVHIIELMPGTPVKTADGTTEASHVIWNGTGAAQSVKWVWVYDSASEYILIIDAAAVPANGTVTMLAPPTKVSADSTTLIALPDGIRAKNGIVICNSSTAATKTIGGSTCIFAVQPRQ